ncbi:Hypothetical protein SRAE_2000362500 [Strongyloides ratti]|uniref:Uncharacterized protein n=1 Tax=Strongyloides ratti TaxID=34506 RepID=A0A090LGR5_STRRB|nr:Hypothetical protein SRAE_2000362500 [Strongyloides ratti]CEF68972.1 Hypothetical protein SRAE_2000362500 [Strongyloides ratti]
MLLKKSFLILFSFLQSFILFIYGAPTVYINNQPFSRIRDQLTQPIFEGVYYANGRYGDIKYTDKPAQVRSNNNKQNYHFTDSPFRILSSNFEIRLNGGSYDCKKDEIIAKCGLIPLYSYQHPLYNSLFYTTNVNDVNFGWNTKIKFTLIGYVAREQRCGARVEVNRIVVKTGRQAYTRLISNNEVVQQYGPNFMFQRVPYMEKTKGFFYAWEPIGNRASFEEMRKQKQSGDNFLVDGSPSPKSTICLVNQWPF